ncbi:VOC family protein [Rathayibacter sp. VKM Ac-2835]|uniref:VOC family protein n=1 Tax=Rathayibacter sp. VKM Ac-2835 TaxID=2739043 RepID=UPI0015657879|nr:VOC family protein [Rathayibacter sp. VKM Ac-2835]
MKPTYVYLPTDDLTRSSRFYRETLGLEEVWREGDDTVAFALPEDGLQLMLSTAPGAQGVMYRVPSVKQFLDSHEGIVVVSAPERIPGGVVVGLEDASSNAFYVFDQVDPVTLADS